LAANVWHAEAGFALGAIVELFRAEKLGHLEANSQRDCNSCKGKLKLIKAVFFPETVETIRMFECDCGERIWDE